MPSLIYDVTTPAGYLPFNVNAAQTVTFSIVQPVEGTSYFTLETKAKKSIFANLAPVFSYITKVIVIF